MFIPIAITHKNNNYPIWYSRNLVKIIHQKDRAHKRWKKYGNLNDYQEFSLLRNRYHKVHKDCYKDMTINAQDSIKSNPKNFWLFVKSKRGRSQYPNTVTVGNTQLNNGSDITKGFNDFFMRMFSPKASSYPTIDLPPPQYGDYDGIHTMQISESKVNLLLKKLSTSKGAGDDNVASIFIVKCASSLAYPLIDHLQ